MVLQSRWKARKYLGYRLKNKSGNKAAERVF